MPWQVADHAREGKRDDEPAERRGPGGKDGEKT
jgi:hypothetical protein